VCIFLVDNKDGISDPVLKEMKRAEDTKKKSLYLFCNENEQTPTEKQKELTRPNKLHYEVIDRFEQFIERAYECLRQDIFKHYQDYCDVVQTATHKNEYTLSFGQEVSTNTISVKKSFIKGLDRTKKKIADQVYKNNKEIKETSEFDALACLFFEVFIGEKKIREFNVMSLINELKENQSETLYQVTELRWKAIQMYYVDDIESSLKNLYEALEGCRQTNLPVWLSNDILIDIRNLSLVQYAKTNKRGRESEAQKELSRLEEYIYCPIYDRLNSEFEKELLRNRLQDRIKSPYTYQLGSNIETCSDYIADIYAISLYYGSLTGVLNTSGRLKELAFNFCDQYSNWEFRLSLLKFALLEGASSTLERVYLTYREIESKCSESDALSIYKATII